MTYTYFENDSSTSKSDKKNQTKTTQKTPETYKRIIFHPGEIHLPGTSQGKPIINVVDDRYLSKSKEFVSFKSLLLRTIKKADTTQKIKKRKVVKGSEVITHEDFLNQLRQREAEKKKRKRKNERKAEAKKKIDSQKKTSNTKKTTKEKNEKSTEIFDGLKQ